MIRCDNGTKFKNKVMHQFYEMKGIKREFSVARTPQQNEVAKRKNRTIIEAARTMLADLKLPITFWPEAVENMRPFGCPVTILNTLDHQGKFDGKADEGFFVGYSTNSKAFRVFNSRTTIIEENLHVKFSEETPNIAGNGPIWLFDIDALTKSINYKPVVAGNQSNGSVDPSFSSNSKYSPDAGFKPLGEEEKMDAKHPENENSEVPDTEEPRVNQEQDESNNSTNNVNTVSSIVNTASIEDNVVDENIVYGCIDDLNMTNLEEIAYSDDDEEVGVEHSRQSPLSKQWVSQQATAAIVSRRGYCPYFPRTQATAIMVSRPTTVVMVSCSLWSATIKPMSFAAATATVAPTGLRKEHHPTLVPTFAYPVTNTIKVESFESS
ncbi:putative ribonuclease H-like domain-containing protein [Tanacetum coccineum]|uniref:Ribonuclease H-like domain-containing protein n=1 Tax=Tanacetum coccineum TaxID=301880 RepID=A0ABQ4WHR3_9ASTR